MIVIDRMLTGGLAFVLKRLAEVVDAEMNDEQALKDSLMDAQLRHEMGELSAEQLAEIEGDILARLREARAARGDGEGMQVVDAGVTAEVSTDSALGAAARPAAKRRRRPRKAKR